MPGVARPRDVSSAGAWVIASQRRQTVGFNLRRLRAAAGLSQEELAAKTGLDRSYISGIERGRRNPTVIVLNEIAVQLGIDPRELLTPTSSHDAV